MNKFLRSLTAGLLVSMIGNVQADNFCGDLRNHYGPLDYRMRGQVGLEVVERAHFTSDVEAGIKGSTSYLGDDLDYTLRAIPNHARALATMAKLGIRDKTVKVPHARYAVECYFDRAIRFTPDDGAVRAIYGSYLYALGRTDEAISMLVKGAELSPKDAAIQYNTGLAFLKKKDYENARKYAKTAYGMGFPLPGLKNKLVEAGQWEDPAKPSAPADPAGAAPAPPQSDETQAKQGQ